MSLEIGKILICKKRFDCRYTKGFTIEIGDTVTIERFDLDGLPKYLYIINNNNGIKTWLRYSDNTSVHNNDYVYYIWDHFETKTDKAKRIIDVFKNR